MAVLLDITWAMTKAPNTFANLWDTSDKTMISPDSLLLDLTYYNFMSVAVNKSFLQTTMSTTTSQMHV